MRNTILSFLLLVLLGCEDSQEPGPITTADAVIVELSTEDELIYESGDAVGVAAFTYQDGITKIEITLRDMEPGSQHAMHLHQGTLEEPGRHWNQGKFVSFCDTKSMGSFWLKPFAGDVGNISIDENGNGSFTLSTDLWSLGTNDEKDITGTVLFIHQNFEDFGNECDPFHTHEHGDHMNPKIGGGTVVLSPEASE